MPYLQIYRSAVAPPCVVSNLTPMFCSMVSESVLMVPRRYWMNSSRRSSGDAAVNGTIRCMASTRRARMVGKQIMRELSDMLLSDKVLQCAVLPEAALGADRYLSSLTTITDVEVSAALQIVKVYVSVFGDERGKEVALSGLKSKAKYIRSALGKRMKLRFIPEIRFIEDESFERGSRVLEILDKIKDENEKKGSEAQADDYQGTYDPINDDTEDLDDKNIIYVR